MIMAGAIGKRKDSDASVLALAKVFRGLKPETEKPVRPIELVDDETLEKMKEAWKPVEIDKSDWNASYENALAQVKKLKYTAKDVENFSIALAGFQNEGLFSYKAGYFLSALINNCKDNEFIIHTAHLELIRYFGYKNTKNIVVKGDLGGIVGLRMECGSITVEGNAGDWVGDEMNGGNITVKGNATDWAGDEMKGGVITVEGDVGYSLGEEIGGGTIIVKGNAGNGVGRLMTGGEIRLEGEYGGIGDNIKHGKIFHKGVLIVDK